MEETPVQTLTILYIGNDQATINQFQESGLFDMTVMPNGLSAIYWLTDQNFRLFNFDKNVEHAPIYMETKTIDAILCETKIPGMKGLAFYRKLKLHNIYTKIPFILLAVCIEGNIMEEAMDAGVDDYYHCRFSPERVFNRIRFLQKFKSEFVPKPLDSLIDQNLSAYQTPYLKRSFDILVALLALLLLAPVILITMLAIRIESRGKVYYFSKRVGANYKIFDFYKFRSMYPDADKRLKEVAHLNQYITDTVEESCSECAKMPEGGHCSPLVYYDGEEICERLAGKRKSARKAFLKIVDDPRITKVGKFIRQTSIDELPQLFNVLKGDMSIVGNRPLPLNEAEALTKKKWSRRFNASAGLTGLWQIKKRGKGGLMSEEERFTMDNHYAEHNTFWGDIAIIFRTFGALFQKENV
ncbi:MAG: sugar transferase [Bacteroidales bacterium]|nr:sugar transferase [Bacteroidales bacterium]